MAETGNLVLCADDYGLAEGVSRAILALLAEGRLSATSCMTVTADWPILAPRLGAAAGCADIGLHLTLTDLPPLGPMPDLAPTGRLPPIRELLVRALRRRLDPAEIEAELERQLDAFVAAYGGPPDFLDGHQHVHVLPVIREAVLRLMARRLDCRRIYLRQCAEPVAAILSRGAAVRRALIIAMLSRDLARQAQRHGIATNDSFRGINDFRPDEDFRTLFRRFLRGRAARPLVMCHPGFVDAALRDRDSLTDRREDEYRYFAGDEFPRDLAEAGWRLARFHGA